MDQIQQELHQFVVDNFLYGEDKLSNDDSFLEKGLVDSMGILTLVAFVEGKYVIGIADEELVPENWDSVRRIAEFVQSKLKVAK